MKFERVIYENIIATNKKATIHHRIFLNKKQKKRKMKEIAQCGEVLNCVATSEWWMNDQFIIIDLKNKIVKYSMSKEIFQFTKYLFQKYIEKTFSMWIIGFILENSLFEIKLLIPINFSWPINF